MSIQRRNSAYSEGVIDVNIIVPACFDNPLKESAINFLSEVLTGKRDVAIPLSTIIGAYHITTRYLRASRINVRRVLDGMLETRSNALYGNLPVNIVSDALDYASVYNVESWDGVLVAISRSHGSRIVYTLDKDLGKVSDITVVNPFKQGLVEAYHDYIRENIRKQ